MSTHLAYIGLGSNVGDRRAHLQRAVERLRMHPATAVESCSPLFETRALRGERFSVDPPFLNAAIALTTTLAPEALLDALQEIEEALGRPRVHPKGTARTIDLDLLLYDNRVLTTPVLTLPHPELAKRMFVLAPLCAIAPDVRDPRTGRTMRQLRTSLDAPADWGALSSERLEP